MEERTHSATIESFSRQQRDATTIEEEEESTTTGKRDFHGWTIYEPCCLISFWGKESVQQQLVHSCHNLMIFKDFTKKIGGNGYVCL